MVGLVDGDPNYLFGTIHGIAVHEDGRVFVADGQSGLIRVFDADGRFVSRFGGRGDGPGEFYNPCCLNFDDAGRLWVWSDGTRTPEIRYDVFDVAGPSPFLARRIPGIEPGQLWPLRRILFDGGGGVVHPTFSTESVTGPLGREQVLRFTRLHLDSTGAELRRVPVPFVSRDSLGGLPPPRTPGGVSRALPSPLVHGQLRAHSPRGGFAEAVNTRYEVNWYDDEGELVRVIRREVETPPLTAEERADASDRLNQTQRALRERGLPALDLSVPDRHHPLLRLFFDDEGRLWIQRRPAATDDSEIADVYGPDGAYRYTVLWPRDVILYHGAVQGETYYGVSLDDLGVARLVRLRISPAGT